MQPRNQVLLAVGLCAAAAFYVGMIFDVHGLRIATKPLPVLCMTVAAWWSAAGHGYRRAVTAGLLLSAAGDLLLELPGDTFVAGLVCFLVAHFFYIVAFVGADARGRWAVALPFALFGAGMYLYLRPDLAELSTPVAVYVAVICVMGWRAAARLGGGRLPTAGAAMAAVGAVLFIGSDAILAVDKFHFDGQLPGAREINISAYWLGQLLITLSAVRGGDPQVA